MRKLGRLIQEDIIEENIQKHVEKSVSQYTTLMDTTPVFGTYYHQNRIFTTNDLGLENVEEDLGKDSPLRYEKIKNFPFYGIDGFSLSIQRGEIGLDTTMESECLILPNTIKPFPNDYFTLESLGDKYYFKITEYSEDMIKSKPFYKISFRYEEFIDETSNKNIEEQVIEEYQTIFDNIGTDNNCIIKSSTYSRLDYMHKLSDIMKKFFVKSYYDKLNNVMVIKNNVLDVKLYNKYLNKFIIDNELLYDKKDFYSTIKLLEYIPTDVTFDFAYEKTIYYALETKNSKQFLNRLFTYIPITYPHVPWVRSNIKYKDLVFVNSEDEKEIGECNFIEFIDKEFYGRIKLNNLFVSEDDYYMENFIIKYINGSNELPSKELLDNINNTVWRRDMRSYVFIPLLLYIFKKLESAEIKQFN